METSLEYEYRFKIPTKKFVIELKKKLTELGCYIAIPKTIVTDKTIRKQNYSIRLRSYSDKNILTIKKNLKNEFVEEHEENITDNSIFNALPNIIGGEYKIKEKIEIKVKMTINSLLL